tara:strand:- start:669 stop:893 length:225 start_codon:yes stop_codon:yes gene_type:complete
MKKKPLDIHYFFLDSGAEDWHDIHLAVTGLDENHEEVVTAHVELDYITGDGHLLVSQLRGLAHEIEEELKCRMP